MHYWYLKSPYQSWSWSWPHPNPNPITTPNLNGWQWNIPTNQPLNTQPQPLAGANGIYRPASSLNTLGEPINYLSNPLPYWLTDPYPIVVNTFFYAILWWVHYPIQGFSYPLASHTLNPHQILLIYLLFLWGFLTTHMVICPLFSSFLSCFGHHDRSEYHPSHTHHTSCQHLINHDISSSIARDCIQRCDDWSTAQLDFTCRP